jgi:hypothetical protein
MRRRAVALFVSSLISAVAACSLFADFDGLEGTPAVPDSSTEDGGGGQPDGSISADGGAKEDVVSIGDGAADDAFVLSCGAPGLAAFFKLDEGMGLQTSDCSVNHLVGVLEPDSGWGGGVRGGALTMNASYVTLGDVEPLRLTGAMTAAAFIRIVGLGAAERPTIVSKMGNANQRGWELSINTANDGRGARFTVSPDNVDEIVVSSPPIASDEWTHVAGTYSPNGELRVYVNGLLKASTPAPPQQANSPVGARIGGRSYNYYWRGQIDEVRLFSRELTAAEIVQLARR